MSDSSDYLAAMALGKSIVDASTNAERLRSLGHHNNLMRGYDKKILSDKFDAEVSVEKKRAEAEKSRADSMEHSANFYRQLLSRPMADIAKYDFNFAKAYAIQEQTLSDWVLSQKAFKDLSYDLGLGMGYEEEDVDDLYIQRTKDIANGTNPNEMMPERLVPYANQSKDNLAAAVEQKRRIATKNTKK